LLVWSISHSWGASYTPAQERKSSGDELFTNSMVRHLQIEISTAEIQALRRNSFMARNGSQRTNVSATVREGKTAWTNVAIHIKGSFGSFRSITDKPALTLNFDKWSDGQVFHGLQKISLNNSVQDDSYLAEKLCREIYSAAGVPTPRADYATVELNGRFLGLFVLTEGWNKQFLKRHFKSVKGNFYDSGSTRDVDRPMTAAFGENPTNHAILDAVKKAALEPNHAKRMERLRATVDLDRFVTLTALDCMMWNWDGYALNRNNYRVFHDLDANRLVFFPHGVDQMFWKYNGPIVTGRSGLVAKALLETEEGRRLHLERVVELRASVFNVTAITNRVMELRTRLKPAVARSGILQSAQFESAVNVFRNRILARGRDIDQQLASVKNMRRLELNETMSITNWEPRQKFGSVVLDQTSDSPATMHLKIRNETSFGAWNATTWLEEGRYIIEGRVKTRGVAGALHNEPGGAGFRVWSDRKETRGASWSWFPYVETRDPQNGGLIPVVTVSVEERLVGDTDWKTITHEFELRQPLADLQIQCVLQGTAGEAWFNSSSIKIRRLSLNVGKTAARE
jgi:hypothetical protein